MIGLDIIVRVIWLWQDGEGGGNCYGCGDPVYFRPQELVARIVIQGAKGHCDKTIGTFCQSCHEIAKDHLPKI